MYKELSIPIRANCFCRLINNEAPTAIYLHENCRYGEICFKFEMRVSSFDDFFGVVKF